MSARDAAAPLAERRRPRRLDEVLGQEAALAPVRAELARGKLGSVVLWGPPGCGKTTIARCLAEASGLRFLQLSAVLDGVKELREALDRANTWRKLEGRGTLLFVDEIHRWNKAQQDALLPHLESGALTLVGATTENPGFELNAALRSRVRVVRLEALGVAEITRLLREALASEAEEARGIVLSDAAIETIAAAAAGDARRALGDLERLLAAAPDGAALDTGDLPRLLLREDLRHDRAGEDHHNVTSALIKSLRGSDPDAALYWLARMLAAGEDLKFICRRLMIFAAEDVGNADPRALGVAVDCALAVERIGMPEARILLGQAVTWLATCPKSNAAYLGIDAALAEVRRSGALPVPLHLRQGATDAARAEGWGAGYRYPHDLPHRVVEQQHLPDALVGRRFYTPSNQGNEKTIAERLEWWERKRRESGGT